MTFRIAVKLADREIVFTTAASSESEAKRQAQAWAARYSRGLDARGVSKTYFPPASASRGA